MDPSDALLAARDIMRERGMCRGIAEDDEGRVCLLGALNMAMTGQAWGCNISNHGAYALDDECQERYGTFFVSANNDHIADLDEACDVLEAAAKRAAEEGS